MKIFLDKMFKIFKFLFNFRIKIIILVFLLSSFLFSSCDTCQTAEDMQTEEFQIKIHGNSPSYDDLKPESYWVPSKIFVNKNESVSGANNPSSLMKVNILSNNLDLCFNESTDFSISSFYISIDGLKVFKDDLIEITPIKHQIVINDCANPPSGVFVHDITKCQNGYRKQQSGEFIEKFEGKTFEVESYIVNENDLYNVMLPASSSGKILPGKKLVIPFEYEDCDKDNNCTYSFLPKIPGDHQVLLEMLKGTLGDTKNLTKKYWCGAFKNSHKLIPSENVNGVQLNEFCDNFYKFDTIEYDSDGQGVDRNKSDASNCPSDFSNLEGFSGFSGIGNTSDPSKIYSFISSGCLQDFEIEKDKTISIFTNQSRFFYQLGLFLLDGSGSKNPLNEEYNSKSYGKLFGRIDASNIPQIPLEKPILITKDGVIGAYLRKTLINHEGSYRCKIKKSCKAKKLFVYFSENGSAPQIHPSNLESSNNQHFQVFDLIEDENGTFSNIDDFSIDLSSIPNKGWIFFAIEDNGDGYQNNNGILTLSIKRPKFEFKENFFIETILNKILENIRYILFGYGGGPGVTQVIYHNIVKSPLFRDIINVFLLVFITAYGLMIVAGLTQFQGLDLTKTALKVGFIYALLMPQSWEFFNKNLFNLFIEGPGYLLSLILTNPGEDFTSLSDTKKTKLVFGTVSYIFSNITDISFFKQVISLLFAFPFGWIAFIIIFISFIWLIYATFSAIMIYIISMVLISLFLSVAPLFIMTLMFKYTNKIFRAWFKVLISNALTLIFTFVGLYMLGTMISVLLDDIFSFGVCTRCVFLYRFGFLEFCMMYAALPDQFPELYSYDQLKMMQQANSSYASEGGFFYGLPIALNKLLALYILSYLARKSVDVFAELASEVSDIGFGGPGGSGGILSGVKSNFDYWFGKNKTGDEKNEAKKNKGASVELKDDESKKSKEDSSSEFKDDDSSQGKSSEDTKKRI
jgi:type IV secretory pathway VirB6-like protein